MDLGPGGAMIQGRPGGLHAWGRLRAIFVLPTGPCMGRGPGTQQTSKSFPGTSSGPVVKTQCRGRGFDPWSGN